MTQLWYENHQDQIISTKYCFTDNRQLNPHICFVIINLDHQAVLLIHIFQLLQSRCIKFLISLICTTVATRAKQTVNTGSSRLCCTAQMIIGYIYEILPSSHLSKLPCFQTMHLITGYRSL